MAEEDDPPFSLEAGIDAGRFTSSVRNATAALRQGTLVAEPPLLYAADPAHPLYVATVAWATSDKAAGGVVNIVSAAKRPAWGLIVSQTCDLVEEGRPKRPWTLIAPVYQLSADRGTRRMIELERGYDYLCPVTGLDADDDSLWVADLRLLVPVEKGWLVGAINDHAFVDEAGYERLARQLGRLFSRTGYATPLVTHVLKPLNALLEKITKKYDGEDNIAEVALALGRSRLDPTNAQVVFLLEGPIDDDLRDMILAWGQSVLENPPEGVNVLMPRIAMLDDLTAREYRTLDHVDVSAFSPDAVIGATSEAAPVGSAQESGS
jgi:hypothetical protein